jgi:hypothetical protein
MPTVDGIVREKFLEKHSEVKNFCKPPPHYEQPHKGFSCSVAIGKFAFSSIVDNNENDEDDDSTDNVDAEAVVTNSTSVSLLNHLHLHFLDSH